MTPLVCTRTVDCARGHPNVTMVRFFGVCIHAGTVFLHKAAEEAQILRAESTEAEVSI